MLDGSYLAEEAKLPLDGHLCRQVSLEEIDQLAVVTPHQLSHRLGEEALLFETGDGGADQLADKQGPALHHHCRALATQMWVRNHGQTADADRRSEVAVPAPTCWGW